MIEKFPFARVAEAYARMTEETLHADFDYGDHVIYGTTSLQSHIEELVEGHPAQQRAE